MIICHSLFEVVIEVILDAGEVTDTVGTVHTVIDGNESHIVLREGDLHEHSCLQIISAKPGLVFDDDDANLAGLHILHHPFEIRAVEAGSRITVIHIELDIGEAVLLGVLLQY